MENGIMSNRRAAREDAADAVGLTPNQGASAQYQALGASKVSPASGKSNLLLYVAGAVGVVVLLAGLGGRK